MSKKHYMPNNFPLVSIIIVNFNGKEVLKKFLPSVFNLSYPNYEVIVVDNASTDGSPELLTQFPAKIVINDRNLGWGGGCNSGAKQASGEYLWFLNNDIEVVPDSLTELVTFMEQHLDVGICASWVFYHKDKKILWSGGNNIAKNGLFTQIGIGMYNPERIGPYEISYAEGCALLIRRVVYNTIREWDENIFIGCDDADISVRCWLSGYRVMTVPSSKVYHEVSYSTHRQDSYLMRFYFTFSHFYFILKNLQTCTRVSALPFSLLNYLASSAFGLMKGDSSILLACIKAIWWIFKKFPHILYMRKGVQQLRKVPDKRFINLRKKL